MQPYTLLTQNDDISPQDRHSTSFQTNIFCNFHRGHPVVFHELRDKQTGYRYWSNTTIHFVILIVMATCFGPSDHPLAI